MFTKVSNPLESITVGRIADACLFSYPNKRIIYYSSVRPPSHKLRIVIFQSIYLTATLSGFPGGAAGAGPAAAAAAVATGRDRGHEMEWLRSQAPALSDQRGRRRGRWRWRPATPIE